MYLSCLACNQIQNVNSNNELGHTSYLILSWMPHFPLFGATVPNEKCYLQFFENILNSKEEKRLLVLRASAVFFYARLP